MTIACFLIPKQFRIPITCGFQYANDINVTKLYKKESGYGDEIGRSHILFLIAYLVTLNLTLTYGC